MLAAASALLLLAATPAKAVKADCPAAERKEPTLDVKRLPSARFKVVDAVIGSSDYGKVDLVYPRGIETAVLKSGVKVRVELGGCETWGTTYEFALPSGTRSLADGRYWFEQAGKLIDEVELVSRPGSMRFKELRSALRTDARQHPRYDFSKTEFADEITFPKVGHRVGVRRKNGVTYLTVGYYIPL